MFFKNFLKECISLIPGHIYCIIQWDNENSLVIYWNGISNLFFSFFFYPARSIFILLIIINFVFKQWKRNGDSEWEKKRDLNKINAFLDLILIFMHLLLFFILLTFFCSIFLNCKCYCKKDLWI